MSNAQHKVRALAIMHVRCIPPPAPIIRTSLLHWLILIVYSGVLAVLITMLSMQASLSMLSRGRAHTNPIHQALVYQETDASD